MANLKNLNTAIDKFILNERRIEIFINDEYGYTADDGTYVPSLKEIYRQIQNGEIPNGGTTPPPPGPGPSPSPVPTPPPAPPNIDISNILEVYMSYAEAVVDLENRFDDSYSRVLRDETREFRDTIYYIMGGNMIFIKYEDIPDSIDLGTY